MTPPLAPTPKGEDRPHVYILYDERYGPGENTDDANVLEVFSSPREARRTASSSGHLYRWTRQERNADTGLCNYSNEEYVEFIHAR